MLAEIHNEPDLKLNLKFEIEVLCKDLGIDLSQIEPTGVLKDTERLVRVPQQLGELASLSQPESGSQMPLGPPPMGIAPPIDRMYYLFNKFLCWYVKLCVTNFIGLYCCVRCLLIYCEGFFVCHILCWQEFLY